MLLRLLVNLTDMFPTFRRWVWKRWYQHIAGYDVASWSFMNYGYAPADDSSETLELEATDEDDRFCIQLYHRVASAVSLKDLDVLEVGSGRGGGSSFVKRYLNPATMTGVDFSVKAVKFCRERHQIEGLSFQQGDAENLSFNDATFDAVVNVESSHCYGSMPSFLSQVYRVLRPGGCFLFTDFRTSEEIGILEEQLIGSGLTIVEQEDITPNVVSALKQDSERKQTLIRQHIRGWLSNTFQQFAGVEDSEVLASFESRSFIYKRYVLRKPT